MPRRVVAFDADALIYSAAPDHPLGTAVAKLLQEPDDETLCIGSVLLVPELLIKPLRSDNQEELESLTASLSYLQLIAVDDKVAELAASLGAGYRLKAIDAVHLASAVRAGADLFVTNNRKDFDRSLVVELEVAYPGDLH